jgi:drug/metabolite transporter (DMT)-like permease
MISVFLRRLFLTIWSLPIISDDGSAILIACKSWTHSKILINWDGKCTGWLEVWFRFVLLLCFLIDMKILIISLRNHSPHIYRSIRKKWPAGELGEYIEVSEDRERPLLK